MHSVIRKTGGFVKKNIIPITVIIVGVGVVIIYMKHREIELLKDIQRNRNFEESLLVEFLNDYDLNALWDGHGAR